MLPHLLQQAHRPFKSHPIFLWLLSFPSSSLKHILCLSLGILPFTNITGKKMSLLHRAPFLFHIHTWKKNLHRYKMISIFSVKQTSSCPYQQRCNTSDWPLQGKKGECHICLIHTHTALLPNGCLSSSACTKTNLSFSSTALLFPPSLLTLLFLCLSFYHILFSSAAFHSCHAVSEQYMLIY